MEEQVFPLLDTPFLDLFPFFRFGAARESLQEIKLETVSRY